MTSTPEGAKQIREIMFSPLKRYRKEHCQQCGLNCNPSEQHFLACLLSALIYTTIRQEPETKHELFMQRKE